ncbi:sugar-binding protein [Moorella naiadis]|uniref:sugar-binding protein n=1 Tax=Moorella naiadis (nom. illeg.) TaxID=3093670 RepID=UPI003D9CA154
MSIKKRGLLLFLVSILLFVFLAGCSAGKGQTDQKQQGNQSQTAEQKPPAKTYKFVLVSPFYGHPYWKMVEDGMKAANKEFGVNTSYVGPNEINIDEQIRQIELAIAQKADGIITMALNPTSFTPVINKAVEAGIPVVLIDTDAPNSKRVAYAGTDNKTAGKEAGKALVKLTNGKAKVGIITGAIDADNLNLRIDGFKEAISGQDIQIVDIQPSNSDLMKGVEKAKAMLQAHPDITAFFGVSATDVVAAAKAVQEGGKTGKITLVGFDDLPETIDLIKKGVVNATVVQRPYQMGYLGVKLLMDIKEGKQVPPITDTGVVIVTKENADTYNK